MNPLDDMRGTFLGHHIVLGALIESHPDLKAFAAALERNSAAMLRASEKAPDSMLHPAEHTIDQFANLAAGILRERGEK